MFSFFCGLLRRLFAPFAMALLLLAEPLVAHEGHDHGAPAAATTTSWLPRIALHSDTYEVVGVLRGAGLTLFLDRYAGNDPVVDARIAASIGVSGAVTAMPAGDWAYRLPARNGHARSLQLGQGTILSSGGRCHGSCGTFQRPDQKVVALCVGDRKSQLQRPHSDQLLRRETLEPVLRGKLTASNLVGGYPQFPRRARTVGTQ